MQNYLEYKDYIGYSGLGIILEIKNKIFKIPYQVLGNNIAFKIENKDIFYLDNSIFAESKEELNKEFQKQLILLYRKYLENNENIDLKIKQFLENTFELNYFSQILPTTSLKPLIYLSKFASLAMPYTLKTGDMCCDYFDREIKYDKNQILCGDRLNTNTNFIYNDLEIIDISNFLIEKENIAFDSEKCYMATHYCAIIDLVLEHIFKYQSFKNQSQQFRLFFIDEYISDNDDICKIKQMLQMAFPYLNQAQQNEIKRWCNTYSI